MAFIRKHKRSGDLDTISFAFTFGIITSFSVLFLGVTSAIFGGFEISTMLISEGYLGFSSSFIGGVIGAVWGFFDGFIGGYIFAWLYNYIKNKRT